MRSHMEWTFTTNWKMRTFIVIVVFHLESLFSFKKEKKESTNLNNLHLDEDLQSSCILH